MAKFLTHLVDNSVSQYWNNLDWLEKKGRMSKGK
jgi:hypothetical protein